MSETLLVELLTEELPPRSLQKLGQAFADGIEGGLRRRNMLAPSSAARPFATPRRLGVQITDVLDKEPDAEVESKLVPATVGIDAAGQMTEALRKRLSAFGDAAELFPRVQRRLDGKQEMLFLKRLAAGQTLARALNESLEEAIKKLPIAKVMSYQLADGETTEHFVRPAHRLVALHGKDIVELRALGLKADRVTEGHRFQAASKPIKLTSASGYEDQMAREGNVIADFAKRRAAILAQLESQAGNCGGTLGAAAEYSALLDEVTALVEMPTVYVGAFEPEFLAVPAECLVLTMRQNQKYFPLFDAAGNLTHRFLIVSNMRLDDPANIVRGNERVVRPRLADARFFFETDRKVKLERRVPQLGTIVYHNKLGTQLQRVDRLVQLATEIQKGLPRGEVGIQWAVRAAYLAKADLVTLMVGEFPELQGVMGRYYAEADEEPPSVARAIEQHYWPRFAGDMLPTGDASIAVALADRLDALVGMFSIGQAPTGDKDPFALRRAALGIVRILMESKPALQMELQPLLRTAAQKLNVPRENQEALVSATWEFVRERLANLMRERGYSAHEVAAVVEVQSAESKPDRLDLVPARLEAVREFGTLPEAGSLAAANKRISNILRQAHQKGEKYELGGDAFGEKLERDLHAALKAACAQAVPQFDKGNYTGYLKSFAALKSPVDAFFEGVMVMADDAGVRRQRLGLLYTLQFEMNRVADIAKLAS